MGARVKEWARERRANMRPKANQRTIEDLDGDVGGGHIGERTRVVARVGRFGVGHE